MTIGTLTIVLSVIFAIFVVGIAGALFFVFWRHRSFRYRSSPAPTTHHVTPNFSIADPASKELIYFFGLKPQLVVPPGAPNKDIDAPSQVVDFFKLFDAKGPSRFPSPVKEEVESKKPDVDISNKPSKEEVVVVTVNGDAGNTKTVFSTPCDSPMFFTPVGSPSRDNFLESEFVVSVNKTVSNDAR